MLCVFTLWGMVAARSGDDAGEVRGRCADQGRPHQPSPLRYHPQSRRWLDNHGESPFFLFNCGLRRPIRLWRGFNSASFIPPPPSHFNLFPSTLQ